MAADNHQIRFDFLAIIENAAAGRKRRFNVSVVGDNLVPRQQLLQLLARARDDFILITDGDNRHNLIARGEDGFLHHVQHTQLRIRAFQHTFGTTGDDVAVFTQIGHKQNILIAHGVLLSVEKRTSIQGTPYFTITGL